MTSKDKTRFNIEERRALARKQDLKEGINAEVSAGIRRHSPEWKQLNMLAQWVTELDKMLNQGELPDETKLQECRDFFANIKQLRDDGNARSPDM